jgi:hypothetical protein
MTLRQNLALAAAITLLPAAALAQKVNTDFAPGTDFSKYRTYTVVEGKSKPASPLAAAKIQAAIDTYVVQHGLQKAADPKAADVALIYNVATQQGATLNTFYDGWAGGPYGPGWRYGWGAPMGGMATTTVTQYTQGSLIIDMFDIKAKTAIWRGTATDTLSDNPEKNTKKVNKAVEKMFKKYPPKP